jgi:hypothetical protein
MEIDEKRLREIIREELERQEIDKRRFKFMDGSPIPW